MAEDENAEQGESNGGPVMGPRRKKSTGFPVVSLAEAAAILKDAGKYGFEHSTAAFAAHMGHSTTNSGAFRQRLAAFRDWKLIAGRGDSLAMTDIGRMIAVPTDDVAEKRALQVAFMNCHEFAKLYDGSAKGQALEVSRLAGRAVHDFGVAPSSKDKFVQSFTESAIVAGLAERTDDGNFLLVAVDADGSAEVHGAASSPTSTPPSALVAVQAAPSGVSGPPVGVAPAVSPVVHHVLPIDGGEISFQITTTKPLPASAFATVGDVIASLERLASTLAPVDDGALEPKG